MKFNDEVDTAVNDASAFTILADAKKPVAWLVDNLIEDDRDKGHQWIITGEPKKGKSRLAMQLAVCLAEGTDFIGFKVRHKRKVLYFNFELSRRVAASRVLEFFGGEARLLEAANNFFVVSNYSQIDILDAERADVLKRIVEKVNPDVIIWDVLRRMSSADENNNGEMSVVMQSIRLVSSRRTHFVVHHSKKELYDMNRGARGIRGASAIHAECDGVISIAKVKGRHTLEFSARSIADLDSILLNSDGIRFVKLCEAPNRVGRVRSQNEIADLLPQNWLKRKELKSLIMTRQNVSVATADRKLEEWVVSGMLEKMKDGREMLYRLKKQSPSKSC